MIYQNFDRVAGMNQYIQLLRKEPIVRRLSTIQLIVYFGAWFSNVAIYTLLLNLGVDAATIAFVAMLHVVAGVLQAPFSGLLLDRLKPKKLMLVLIAIEFFATLLMIVVESKADLVLLYALIFLKMAAASFYFTAEMSLLPKVIFGKELQRANELHSMIWSLSYTLGMALSGFFVYWLGVRTAFVLDAMMFLISFVMLYTLKLEIGVIKTEENLLFMMRDTFSYLKQSSHAKHLMILHAFVGLTAFDALVALMVDHYYAGIIATSLALGFMHAARAFGLVIGPMFLSKIVDAPRLRYIFLAQALSIWLWAYMMESFYLSMAASVVVGLFTTTLWSYTYTLLQKNIDEKYYGRIIAYNDMLFLSVAALTSWLIGYLVTNSFSLEEITSLLGSGFIAGALYLAWILKTQTIKDVHDI